MLSLNHTEQQQNFSSTLHWKSYTDITECTMTSEVFQIFAGVLEHTLIWMCVTIARVSICDLIY